MSDKKTVRDDKPHSEPHEEGQYVAVCADVVDLGLTVEQYQQQPAELKDKVALIFRTTAERDGKPLHIAQEFTCSMGKKANLRKFLEAWRGKPYSDEEAKKQGIPLDKLEGQGALVTIAHKQSQAGNTYAYISSITRLPKKMEDELPALAGYERHEFWAKKKDEYRAKAETFKPASNGAAKAGQSKGGDFSDFPESLDNEDDDLPF